MPRWPKKDAVAPETQDVVFPAPPVLDEQPTQLTSVKKEKAQLTFAPKPWVKRFLKYLAQSGNVAWSCEKARIRQGAAYQERKVNALFAAQWAEAMEVSLSVLEVEARRRAVEGTLLPVYSKGKKVGVATKYSDTLLMFLMKAAKPEVYRDNVSIEHNVGEKTLSTAAALISAMRVAASSHDEVVEPYIDLVNDNEEENDS
jgi:hypothetical protein